MIERCAIHILPIGLSDLEPIRALMTKYCDLPMDFADASLVQVARRERINRVFTLDSNDFSIYRFAYGKAFELLPGF